MYMFAIFGVVLFSEWAPQGLIVVYIGKVIRLITCLCCCFSFEMSFQMNVFQGRDCLEAVRTVVLSYARESFYILTRRSEGCV